MFGSFKAFFIFILALFSHRPVDCQRAFTSTQPIHKYFNGTTKCTNRAYSEMFNPASEDKGISRANSFLFSQVAFVGNVTEKRSEASTYNMTVKVECVLRGQLNLAASSGLVKVINIPRPDTPSLSSFERCFRMANIMPPELRVLVFGNMAADQLSVIPIESGVTTLGSDDADSIEYSGLRCSSEVKFLPSSFVAASPFCKRHSQEQCQSTYLEGYTILRANEDLSYFRWADLKSTLKSSYRGDVDANTLKPSPYDYTKYASVTPERKKPIKRNVKPRRGNNVFPLSTELRNGEGNVIFKAASVEQVEYLRKRVALLTQIMDIIKRELVDIRRK